MTDELDAADLEDAISSYQAGESLRSLERRLGIGRHRIAAMLEGSGIAVRSNRYALDNQAIVNAYHSGLTVATLAETFGVSIGAIVGVLRKMDVAMRTRAEVEALKQPRAVRHVPFDAALLERYRAGETLSNLTRDYACGHDTIVRFLREQGVTMRPTEHNLPDAEIASAYQAGESELGLSRRFNVSRNVIRRRLMAQGVAIRGATEANIERMKRLTPDERRALARAAHDAARGRERPEALLERLALMHQQSGQYVGAWEQEFAALLEGRGHLCVPQLAVGRYNLDIAVSPVAVEIMFCDPYPLRRPKIERRTKYLLERGWSVEFIWVNKRHSSVVKAAEDAHRFVERTKRDPALIGCYRVVRGSGEFVAAGRLDADHLALVETAIDPLETGSRD